MIRHLAKVRIVLVGTSHPGNIGGAARAMKNMHLEKLYLVNPKAFPHSEATARASGASEILANAIVCHSLMEALEGCTLVIATSARRRTLRWPQLSPKVCAQRMLEHAANSAVALVFGRERTGLSNAELDLCHFMTFIPCNPQFSSLNLAAAVQIMGYELMNAAHEVVVPGDAVIHLGLADAGEIERFYQHLEQTLIALEFLNPQNPKHLMRRLRRMYNRIRLSKVEVSVLRGILTATQKHIT